MIDPRRYLRPNEELFTGDDTMAKKPKAKMEKVMGEFKRGTLHSGSKTGPKVKDRKQAIAIGLSEARKRRLKGKAV